MGAPLLGERVASYTAKLSHTFKCSETWVSADPLVSDLFHIHVRLSLSQMADARGIFACKTL